MSRDIVISTRTILIFLGILVLGALLYQIRDVLLQLLIALILALSFEPVIKYMVKKKVPRWLASSLVFVAGGLLIALFLTLALPLVITQTRKLLVSFPVFLASIIHSPELRASLNASLSQLTLASGGVFSVTISIFSNAIIVMTLVVFTLYLSMDLPNVKRRFLGLFTEDLKDYIDDTWDDIEVNLSRWVMGQVLLMFAVGLSGLVGLLILGVPFAVPLALTSGILEIVPVLGPIVATVIAGIVGFSISPVTGVLVLALFIGIQQLENGILVPRIMQKIIGFNPLVTMIALLIGGKLFGVVGAIISIPVALIAVVIFHKLINIDLED